MIQLSIIIPTRNRSVLLHNTLESIAKQSFPIEDYEVIVIDNGSTDDTKEVVKSFETKLPHLVYHYDATPGLHVGRHNGYKLAKSEILVYADDDIEAFPTWLEGIYESFQDPEVVLVGGKDLPKYEEKPPFWIEEQWYNITKDGRSYDALSLIDLGDSIKEIPPYYVFGCNYSVRKSLIAETKGFHPDGVPFYIIEYRGDGEWYVNKYIVEHGYKVLYNPKASVYHVVTKDRMTLDYLKRRAFRKGVEQSYADKRYNLKSSKMMIRRFLSKILHGTLFQKKDKLMTDMEKEIAKSYNYGYNYHDTMYNNDKKIREWVHKDNYLDI